MIMCKLVVVGGGSKNKSKLEIQKLTANSKSTRGALHRHGKPYEKFAFLPRHGCDAYVTASVTEFISRLSRY